MKYTGSFIVSFILLLLILIFFTYSLYAYETVDITSPGHGESWLMGSEYTIKWSYSSYGMESDFLLLGLYFEDYSFCQHIGIASSSEDNYEWFVPRNLTPNIKYRIGIETCSDIINCIC